MYDYYMFKFNIITYLMNIAIDEGGVILTFDRDFWEADKRGKLIEKLINKKEFDFDKRPSSFTQNGIRQRIY